MTAPSRQALFLALVLASATGLAAETGTGVDTADRVSGFDILEYDVEGNSVLTDAAIEHAVTPYLGESQSIKAVEGARAALEAAYHDAGYLTVVVSIPEQKVDDGNIVLHVVEGRIDRLRVKGQDYHLASNIRQQVPELAEGNVPYFPDVQNQLDALNRGADLKATPVLKAGRTPGTVEVNLDVDDQLPLHGNVELNNHETPGTKPLRLEASMRYDNLWQRDHSLNLSAQVSPQAIDQYKMLAATYVLPIDRKGDALALYAVHSSSNVPGPTSVLNNSDIGGLRFALPLPATADYSQSLSLGADYKNIHSVTGLIGGGTATLLQPPIRYVPLVAAYNGAWLESGGSTALDATATFGLRGLFGNHDTDFNAKRPGASADYFVLRSGIGQTETLRRWTLSGRAEVQMSSGPLLPNEQYAAGGASSVRGYQESEQSGDRALRLSVELRSPSVSLGPANWPLRLTAVGFYDAVRLTALQFDPLANATLPALNYLMRGTGIGVRLSAPKGLSFDMDIARAFDDGGNGQVNTKSGDVRVHSRLVWDY